MGEGDRQGKILGAPDGQTLKCLTVIDEYTRECLAIEVAGSIRSVRVIEVLSRLVSQCRTWHH
jgi:putative transposase